MQSSKAKIGDNASRKRVRSLLIAGTHLAGKRTSGSCSDAISSAVASSRVLADWSAQRLSVCSTDCRPVSGEEAGIPA